MGSDNIPKIFLKCSLRSLSNPLCHIYNEIIQKDFFPTSWKLSNICTIPKTKLALITKLRPISLLPTISKIFERFYLNYLQPIILPNITPAQFRFVPNSSTTLSLLHIEDKITNLLELPSTAAVISF